MLEGMIQQHLWLYILNFGVAVLISSKQHYAFFIEVVSLFSL